MYHAKKILIVDDEKSICDVITTYLKKEGFLPLIAMDSQSALQTIEVERPDLIILDIMLPDMNGVDLCTEIRKKYNTPILFLSCKTEAIDKIVALSVGGDDYVTKPFLPEELIARVKAHLRRFESLTTQETDEEVYEAPGLLVNATTREVFVDGVHVYLTVKEFDILHLLIKNAKRIYSPAQIFEYAWKTNSIAGDEKTVMVYISNLRKKIEDNKDDRKYIISIRGLGYKFNYQLLSSQTEEGGSLRKP